eukprot:EG_transcript_36945
MCACKWGGYHLTSRGWVVGTGGWSSPPYHLPRYQQASIPGEEGNCQTFTAGQKTWVWVGEGKRFYGHGDTGRSSRETWVRGGRGGDGAQSGGVAIWAAVRGFAATPDVGEMGCRQPVTEKPDAPGYCEPQLFTDSGGGQFLIRKILKI